ncbi:hypothetical protein [Nocardia sp. NPDC058497]|uniref:hypothetical protein n=1 Tax=Nocardia sp. NPDC058497 TaxID=3346529 RepID=UPI0036490704
MLEIHWTDESEAHIAAHGVTPSEVEQATLRPRYLQPGRDETTLLFGRTTAGRYLFVVLAEAVDGRSYIVTAYDMTPNQRKVFNKNAK